MASIRKEIRLRARVDQVWAALRDVAALHERVARGFVLDTRLEGDSRIVTFANGMVVRELIVDVDDAAHRLAYSAKSERLLHHHASFQVSPSDDDAHCSVVWLADLLPNERAADIDAMMQQGLQAMKQTLESR
jgi:Polyketide cyclase / dehydrase and lipid transport